MLRDATHGTTLGSGVQRRWRNSRIMAPEAPLGVALRSWREVIPQVFSITITITILINVGEACLAPTNRRVG